MSVRILRPHAPHSPCALAALALAGCGDGFTSTIGLTRDAPDEFTVTTRAPLEIPNDVSLPPPQPGAARPQEISERRQAEEAMVPALALADRPTAKNADSPGQAALVRQIGRPAPRDIRQRIAEDAPDTGPSRPFTDRLLFWQSRPAPGTVVDPTREAQRLRGNAALGRSVEAGDTPIVQPKRRSPLDGLF